MSKGSNVNRDSFHTFQDTLHLIQQYKTEKRVERLSSEEKFLLSRLEDISYNYDDTIYYPRVCRKAFKILLKLSEE